MLDTEAQMAAEHREKIAKATVEIEEIMLENDFTMGDLLEIFGLYTERANRVFADTKLKTIKESYGR